VVRLFEDNNGKNSQELASASKDGHIRVWSTLNQNNDLFQLKQTIVAHKQYVLCLATTSSSKSKTTNTNEANNAFYDYYHLASGSLKEIRIWHLVSVANGHMVIDCYSIIYFVLF